MFTGLGEPEALSSHQVGGQNKSVTVSFMVVYRLLENKVG